MELTTATSLVGLIAILVAASILSVASFTLAANIAAKAHNAVTRPVVIGRDEAGEIVRKDVMWYEDDSTAAQTLRKRLARYPGTLLIIYSVCILPTLFLFIGLGFGQLTINADGGRLAVTATDNANSLFTFLTGHGGDFVVGVIIPITCLYCIWIIFRMSQFQRGLFKIYNTIEDIMMVAKR